MGRQPWATIVVDQELRNLAAVVEPIKRELARSAAPRYAAQAVQGNAAMMMGGETRGKAPARSLDRTQRLFPVPPLSLECSRDEHRCNCSTRAAALGVEKAALSVEISSHVGQLMTVSLFVCLSPASAPHSALRTVRLPRKGPPAQTHICPGLRALMVCSVELKMSLYLGDPDKGELSRPSLSAALRSLGISPPPFGRSS